MFLNLMRNRLKPKEVNDALTEVEKRSPKDYSTTETNTGLKWIDGKDIYKCVFNFSNVSINNEEITLETITSGLNMVDIKGMFIESNKYYTIPDISIRVFYYATNGNVAIYSPSQWSGSVNLILFYTKPDSVSVTKTKSKKKKNS